LIISKFKDFCDLAGNCLFTPHFGGFLGHIFPKWRHQLSSSPKGPSLCGCTSFEPWSVKIGPTVWPVSMIEKKSRTVKVTKGLYFTHLGRSPHWTEFNQNFHVVWCPLRNHVCQVSYLNSRELRFYRGSNFPFFYWFIDFCMGLTTVQHKGAACDHGYDE